MKKANPRSILITGASSGIGSALALEYAAPGVHLALVARNAERLGSVAQAARAKGASVLTGLVDVRDRAAVQFWIHQADDKHPVDLAITGAGIATGLGLGRPREDPDAVRATIETNYLGAINTIEPLVARMCARRRGRIALVGSLGGVRGVPYLPTYCATKAAIHVYAEALRSSLVGQGVKISLIIPGFVNTPMMESVVSPRPPLAMSSERASQIIRRRLDRGRTIVAFPRRLYYGLLLLNLLPGRITDPLFRLYHVDIPEWRDEPSQVEKV
jgi:NADP-dependent 3-hydroxy acid dehydrogenase YdfG